MGRPVEDLQSSAARLIVHAPPPSRQEWRAPLTRAKKYSRCTRKTVPLARRIFLKRRLIHALKRAWDFHAGCASGGTVQVMCRYLTHQYPQHFACLSCLVAFKGDRFGGDTDGSRRCPSCAAPALAMGRDFKPPRKQATTQWRKLELLVGAGVRFDSCGCGGPGKRPRTLADAKREDSDRRRAAQSRV